MVDLLVVDFVLVGAEYQICFTNKLGVLITANIG